MPRCKVRECTIAIDGRCLEGRQGNCPNLLPDDEKEVVSPPPLELPGLSDSRTPPVSPTTPLWSGAPLEIVEAREFTENARTMVVALAGMIECGKTSLLARIHQLFQSGPVAGYDFAGSRTLFRFEEINWLATVESGVGTPKMEHSSQQYDNSFLHMRVRSKSAVTEPIDLLMNDISGETYPEVIIAQSACEHLLCLQRADHLAVLVDGAAIADRDLRHDHCAKAANFVQRLLQVGRIGSETALHLIITKLDELKKDGEQAENLQAAADLENDFDQFGSRIARIYKWRLAARPMDGSLPTEDVIADLFAAWVGSSYRYQRFPVPPLDPACIGRDYSRFGAEVGY